MEKNYVIKKEEIPIPIIENIHQRVYEACSHPGALNMDDWHTCETTHCRAGWVVHLAGDAGKKLENLYGTSRAAEMIYRNSSKVYVYSDRFYHHNEDAMEDMKRLAEIEAKIE